MAIPESSPIASSVIPPAHNPREREPRGFAPKFFLAYTGLMLAIAAPLYGGLSVKIQSLVGLEQAPAALGLVTGAGALVALFAQPIAGMLSDRTTSRFGMRRPFIVVGVIGVFLSLLLVGLAPSVPLVVIGWAGAQLFSNFAQGAETATIADQVPESRRGFISGLVGSAAPVAIITASFGLVLLPNDFLRSVGPAGLGLVFGLLFALTLKDRVLPKGAVSRFGFKEFFLGFVFNPRKHPDLGWAWLTKALIMLGYASVTTYVTLFLASNFGVTNVDQQLQLVLVANVASTILMGILSVVGGRLSDRSGRRRIFVVASGLIIAIGVLVTALSPLAGPSAGIVILIAAQAIIGAGAGLFFAVDNAMCIDILPDKETVAKNLGVLNIANALPQMIAPFIAGTIVIPLANNLTGGNGYSVWFAIGGLVAVLGSLLVFKIKGVK